MIELVVLSLRGAPVPQALARSFGPGGGTIGRAPSNTLVLDDPDRTVSRIHAQVEMREGQFVIIDRGSNPLQLNGRPLGAGNEARLNPGDRLGIGGFELVAQAVPEVQADGGARMQVTPDDPFADLLSGLGAPSVAPAPGLAQRPAPDDGPFPDPFGLPSGSGARQVASAPSSDADPFADLLGTDTPAPKPGAIEDFSDLGLRAPDAAAGIDHLFGDPPSKGKPGADPLALSPFADPLLQPNTAGDVDPFAALGRGPAPPPAAPRADHVPIDRFGFDVPKVVAPNAPPAASSAAADDPFADLLPEALIPSPAPPPAQAPAIAPAPQAAPALAQVHAPVHAPAHTPVQAPSHSATHAVSAMHDTGDNAELLAALLRGLASTHQMPQRLTPELMERIGVLLRTSAEGTLHLLHARQEVKKGVHAEVTMIAAQANNPLKFSPTVEVALGHLLGPGMRGFMGAEEAMRDAYQDLRAHEFGVMVGMRAALAHVLSRFTPEELEKKITSKSALDSLFAANRKAKLWDQFVALYGSIASEAEDDFHSLFGKAFVQAYEEQMRRLKSGGGEGGGSSHNR
ncbi:type VI secretion system-associated FHA domain protein TagH [Variovorax dokdonensis]|uniref:Type VI secretion system-associated FHA domain protein TagH n=1 Tax=Variovorax dokdonensis TaxID=344883 RepID=A0ABT7NAK3_9BURK|nr:type VI secretion system-associated FHA domain protein TagH [Variovorax dokdonensis]